MSFMRAPAKPAKQWDGPAPTPRAAHLRIADHKARMVVPLPKAQPVRDEAYRRRVAALPCAHCGRAGPSQCAHADSAGKGMGIKSSDFETMPLCADVQGRRGCHSLIGASGMFSKEQRRALETTYVDNTKGLLMGSWNETN
jgi:hypothetical protein